jgi:tryptophanyl-tRNA synthetase
MGEIGHVKELDKLDTKGKIGHSNQSDEIDDKGKQEESQQEQEAQDTINIINIDDGQIIDPFTTVVGTSGKFDYTRLIKEFGVSPITNELIKRFEKVTGKPIHPWIARGLFFSHRELDKILDDYEAGLPIFIYTGRGATRESMHLGHMVPFIMTKWLQDVFDAMVVVQMADDEKVYFKDMDFDEIHRLGFENAKDIIACGFNPDKTFIFSNRYFSRNPETDKLVCEFKRRVNISTIKAIFGLKDDCNVGQFEWPIYQSAAAFSKFFPHIFQNDNIRCIVVYAIDQDPYFRLARDIAQKLNLPKPCAIMSEFLPALSGKAKMSTTGGQESKTIFLTDNPDCIYETIKNFAFSGAPKTLKEHKLQGANLSIDISYQWLRFFELDDQKLEHIATEYSGGRMMTSEIKKILSDIIVGFIKNHQTKRAMVTQEMLDRFYDLTRFAQHHIG